MNKFMSRNCISAQTEALSRICTMSKCAATSFGQEEKTIPDRAMAHLILYGLIKSKVESGEIPAYCLEEYVSSCNQGGE